MATAIIRREVAQLRQMIQTIQRQTAPVNPMLAAIRADPAAILTAAGMTADRWQADLLRSPCSRAMLLCGRQVGKSSAVAALAVKTALLQPGALVLIVARSLRQSSELFRKVKGLYRALARQPARAKVFRPRPVKQLDETELIGPSEQIVQESVLTLELANGSRILSLPGSPDTIVGFSGVALLIIDEASRVPDSVYRVLRPMLAVSKGKLVLLSTPNGKRGFFYEEWEGRTVDGRPLPRLWQQFRVEAPECPRIPADFLDEERFSLGERWYRQEYLCSFEDTIDAVFSYADIHAMLDPSVEAKPFLE